MYTESWPKAQWYSQGWTIAIFGACPRNRDTGKLTATKTRQFAIIYSRAWLKLRFHGNEASGMTIAVPCSQQGPKVIKDDWTSLENSTEISNKEALDDQPLDDDPLVRGAAQSASDFNNLKVGQGCRGRPGRKPDILIEQGGPGQPVPVAGPRVHDYDRCGDSLQGGLQGSQLRFANGHDDLPQYLAPVLRSDATPRLEPKEHPHGASGICRVRASWSHSRSVGLLILTPQFVLGVNFFTRLLRSSTERRIS